MSCCTDDDDREDQPQPARVRGCTDIFWLCLFIAFWFLIIMVAAFSFVFGNPMRLIHGYDSFGNTCGVKYNRKFGNLDGSGQDASEKPYLFFFNMKDIKHSLTICVKQCPDRNMNPTREEICEFYKRTGSELCHYGFNSTLNSCNDKNSTRLCPRLPIYKSTTILNRCVPEAVADVSSGIIYNIYGILNSWDVIEQILGDLYKTRKEIFGLSILAFILSITMIGIFHFLASLVTWIVMVLVSLACIVGTALLWWTYADIKKALDEKNKNELLEESVRNESAFLAFSIIATIITIIVLFLVCILRRRINFMTLLFKESSKCLAAIPGLFFQPLLTFVALLAFYAFWIAVVLCLATANYPGSKSITLINASTNGQALPLDFNNMTLVMQKSSNASATDVKGDVLRLTFVEYVDPTWVKYMWWIFIIALIWVSEFILACQDLVIAGAVAQWYFRGKEARSPVLSAFGKLVFYHLGSVACGSFLITIFKLPRLILTILHEKYEKTKETSSCTRCSMKACICCFYCLEKFIRYMNHNAYTVVAIEGTHFCKAAKIAFETIVSNALQLAVVNGIGDFILFLGKIFVTAVTATVALLILKQNPELHFYAVPVFVICIFAFFIAHCIISLYETVIDTLFLCICEDKNLNGENGKWRQSGLAEIGANNTNGGQHELALINQS